MFNVRHNHNPSTGIDSIHFEGKFIDAHKEQLQTIIDNYQVESFFFHPARRLTLSNKKSRKCRYCDKTFPEVTFNKIAHLIPQLIGNRNLISDYECDSCNHLYGNYEDALAKFLGVGRTLLSIRGQEGVPGFRHKKLQIKKDETGVIITTPLKWDSDHLEIDEAGKKVTLTANTQPYKPIYVYKCLLKIAIGLLREDTIQEYEGCKVFLKSDSQNSKLKDHPYLQLFSYYSPGPPFPTPSAFIWRKRKDSKDNNIPMRLMVIQFSNFTYQIFLPFGVKDKANLKENPFKFHIVPPLINVNQIQIFGVPELHQINLSECKPQSAIQSVKMIFE